MDKQTVWATPMVMNAVSPTVAYASFVSATEIASKTHEDVFVVTCAAPSQCEEEIPEQTITQRIEMMVCPGDDDCPDDIPEKRPPMKTFGYPLGWRGEQTADGTTTEWQLDLTMLRDNERSSGATSEDMITWMATTRVGKEVKTTTSFEEPFSKGCFLYDHNVYVWVSAGVEDLLENYPEDVAGRGIEPIPVTDWTPAVSQYRSICAKRTAGSSTLATNTAATTTDDSQAEETGSADDSKDSDSKDDEDEDGEDGDGESAGPKMSLSFALMGALFAVSAMVS